jgi:hypothetical protein
MTFDSISWPAEFKRAVEQAARPERRWLTYVSGEQRYVFSWEPSELGLLRLWDAAVSFVCDQRLPFGVLDAWHVVSEARRDLDAITRRRAEERCGGSNRQC